MINLVHLKTGMIIFTRTVKFSACIRPWFMVTSRNLEVRYSRISGTLISKKVRNEK